MNRAANFIVRWIVTALAVGFAIALVPGIILPTGDGAVMSILVVSVFLALLNTTIKPILQALSLPVSVLTLGIFAIVVNTAMLYLAVWFATTFFGVGIVITSFGSAFVASILISIATWILSKIAPLD